MIERPVALQQSEEFQRLFDSLRTKQQLFEQMLVLTERQTEVLGDNEKLTQLEQLIQGKQQFIDQITRLDAEIAALTEQLKKRYHLQSLDNLSAGNTSSVSFSEINKRIDELIHQIKVIDDQNIQKLSDQMKGVEAELETLRNGKKATKSYYVKPVQESGYFINRRR